LEDCWRGIILLGRNVASYKFALGRALLDLHPVAGQLVRLEELAAPFARHLCEHLRLAEKQGTFQRSKFLDACHRANAGDLTQAQLVEETVRLGFNNVIDAFHVVGRDEVPLRFFVDERRSDRGIRITDAFSQLIDSGQASNLPEEAEARWRLVETAWELGVSRALVNYDSATEQLFLDSTRRRASITGARAALSGYQKGHCFYCFTPFSLLDPSPPDVDHFFPHSLKTHGLGKNIDGVWNLVLACRRCNRGISGKSDSVPNIKLLERLSKRKGTNPEKVVREIHRRTRRRFSAEEKIRIILEGLRGEESIAELCRREGLAPNLYYRWSVRTNGAEPGRSLPEAQSPSGHIPSWERWPPSTRPLLYYGTKRVPPLPERIEAFVQQCDRRGRLRTAESLGDGGNPVADRSWHHHVDHLGGAPGAVQTQIREM
jgi:transposase-like protein